MFALPAAATILHADLDAFFASVEQRDDPALRGRPVLVGPGIVLAASYEAKACGVSSAMPVSRARRLCPEAVVVPARFGAYVEASNAVMALLERSVPVVEKASIDEAFLDVAGLERVCGSPREIAARLRADVRAECGLPLSIGVGSSKLIAKVASGQAKPDGLVVVEAGQEDAFLHPLPVEKLWGVGPRTAEKLHAWDVRLVGDAARLREAQLIHILGTGGGRRVYAMLHGGGGGLRRVRGGRRRRSIGTQRALGRRPRSWEELDAIALGLADRVTRRMREGGRVGRTVVLRLRFGDYERATRSVTLRRPTATTQVVADALRTLLAAEREVIAERGLTLMGITVTNLDHDHGMVQLELPLDGPQRVEVDLAVDDVRRRFGNDAVQRASLLGSGRPSLGNASHPPRA